ncbi:unnamed protein product [Amoebophrya sp. A25]|nr:unnamed protein product [Amoebophrya sp. A25]|eukprot:GSA25T00003402001.1
MADDPDPTHHGGITLELERCKDCANHHWCSNHVEGRYDEYEGKVISAIQEKAGSAAVANLQVQTNPGPKALGMDVKQSPHHSNFYVSMVTNHINGKRLADVPFCYPRIGGFEVTVMRGGVRNNSTRHVVFSKLKAKRWPNPEWLAERVIKTVNDKLGGFGVQADLPPSPRTYRTPPMTEEKLKEIVLKKFQAVISAFRLFDEDNDGALNQREFKKGLESCGIDLPPNQIRKLWHMCDEDNSGLINYREFARKFSKFKPTHERMIGLSPKGSKRNSRRDSEASAPEMFGVEGDLLDASAAPDLLKPHGIHAMSRRTEVIMAPIDAKCTTDMIRAKIMNRCGNMRAGFKAFDVDGDGRISVDEFEAKLPVVLGLSAADRVPDAILEDIFDKFDRSMSGYIELREFFSDDM